MSLITLSAFELGTLAIGLVLFRTLARWVEPDGTAVPAGPELLLIGILPGLALLTTLFTLLSFLHLLRDWIVVAVAISLLVVLRKDGFAVLAAAKDSIRVLVSALRRGDLFPLAALILSAVIIYIGLFLCLTPPSNIDVWDYHLPLTRSIVEHAGFINPQIPKLLYGTQPMALEMLGAAGMIFVDHFAILSTFYLTIYIGLVLLLLTFARRARGFQLLLLFYPFVRLDFLGAVTPMIDTPRTCISVSAFLFAYRYACGFRRLDLVLSALMAGFSVASKTTELITPLIICATLFPLIWLHRTWKHLIPAAAVFTAISAYWYSKNLILYGNPVFPFLFGHPGLSDAFMRDYMREIGRPFDVADRSFNTNLRTLEGWRDFWIVMRGKFLWLRENALVALAGLMLPIPRRWLLPFWSLLLFIIWYAVMFNSVRWAGTAVMLTVCAAFRVFAFVVDWLLDCWDGLRQDLLSRLAGPLRRSPLGRRARLVASLGLVLMVVFAGVRIAQGRGHSFRLPWMDDIILTAMTSSGDVEKYLNAVRPNYELYRYIGQHQLSQVFQPYDDGAALYASAYNDGKPNRWILHYRVMPARIEDADAFLAYYHVRYFVQPSHLNPVEVERLGPDHVALADRIIADLKPRSRLVMADRFGSRLYEILPRVHR